MNSETLKLIELLASQIVNLTAQDNWKLYMWMGLIALAMSAIGGVVGAYAAKRGEQFAYNAGFEKLKEQLKATTKIVAETNTRVQRLAERTQRIEWMKREKLELYATSIVQGTDHINREMKFRLFDGAETVGDPIASANVLQGLYLPELDNAHSNFMQAVLEFRRWISEGLDLLQEHQAERLAEVPEFAEYYLKHQGLYRSVAVAKHELLIEAARLSRTWNEENATPEVAQD